MSSAPSIKAAKLMPRIPAARGAQRRPGTAASKNGLDWTKRYPWIVETARKTKKKQFILDGEAVVLGVDRISNFDDLHSRQYDEEVQLYALDILAYEGDDLTRLPLHLRKTNLDQLLLRMRAAGRFRMISAERSLPTPCPGERLPLTRIEVGQLRGKDDARHTDLDCACGVRGRRHGPLPGGHFASCRYRAWPCNSA
jgi:hypothetical protein